MVAAKAGRKMAGAVRGAAASAAEPETKRHLCKIVLLGAGPFLGGRGSGLTAHLLDTGNVADLPVRRGRGGDGRRPEPANPPRGRRPVVRGPLEGGVPGQPSFQPAVPGDPVEADGL